MPEPIKIATRDEYDLIVSNGFQPLIEKRFAIVINLRIDIQNEIFGRSFLNKGDVVSGNDRFYHWCWDHIPHYNKCQNCFAPLHNYSAIFVSHILSRKEYPEIAHDPRNINILCGNCHSAWENIVKRLEMAIYNSNLIIVSILKTEYKCL